MSRIPTPATIEAAPVAAQPLLQAVKKQLGIVPNLFRLVSNSPAALEGYLGLFGALATSGTPPTRVLYPSGTLTLPSGEQGLAVSEQARRAAVARFMSG